MCGIVGVTGNNDATNILLDGLQQLEYRGYDSAGIYVNDQNGKDFLVKEKGRISDLRAEVGPEVKGSTGIGHTRWATHGIPSKVNAHPHVSANGRFFLVHNGVIGNFAQLRDEYLQDVTLVSSTDTEVIVQLIGKFSDEGLDTEAAFKKVLGLVDESSSYSFLLMDKEEPDTLFVAKNKSPLLIGVGDGFNVVCSDAIAMLSQTHDFIELVDGEIVIVKPDSITIKDPEGNVINREPFHVDTDPAAAQKGAYPYYMLKEIDEQPGVMRNLVQHYVAEDGSINIDKELLEALEKADRLYIVAAGTSYHAGLVGKELFEKLANIPTEVHVASEFAYNPPLLSEKPFFIFLTQSGETADSRQVLTQVNAQGYPSLTITNVQNSTLDREATYTLLLYAGPEIAVASTKAYSSQLIAFALFSLYLAQVRGTQTEETIANIIAAMQALPEQVEQMLDQADTIKEYAEQISTHKNLFFIGRGVDYAVAQEGSLKLKEISYIHSEAYAAGELKHGTLALIEEGIPVIALATQEDVLEKTVSNIKEVKARGADVMVITHEENVATLLKSVDQAYAIPKTLPILTPTLAVVPLQLLAYYASLALGLDVDKPRNLAKSVTVE